MPCIVVNKKHGIFAAMMDLNDGEDPIMIFTMDHEYKMAVDKVSSFLNPVIAKQFIDKYVPEEERDDYMILLLDKKPLKDFRIATYKDIIDNGLSEWAGYMIDSFPMVSEKIH